MRLKTYHRFGKTLLLCLITLTLLASIAMAGGQSSPAQKYLDNNRRKWESRKIKNYQYTFNWRCYCAPDYVKPVIISVRAGAIAQVSYADGGAIDPSNFERYQTVKGLFEIIQKAIDEKAHKIEVTYDAKSGYPTSAFIDYSANTADEEKGFEAKQLKIVKGK